VPGATGCARQRPAISRSRGWSNTDPPVRPLRRRRLDRVDLAVMSSRVYIACTRTSMMAPSHRRHVLRVILEPPPGSGGSGPTPQSGAVPICGEVPPDRTANVAHSSLTGAAAWAIREAGGASVAGPRLPRFGAGGSGSARTQRCEGNRLAPVPSPQRQGSPCPRCGAGRFVPLSYQRPSGTPTPYSLKCILCGLRFPHRRPPSVAVLHVPVRPPHRARPDSDQPASHARRSQSHAK
jgi:hypothetical protein